MSYTELQVTSNFSFLRGASHPDDLRRPAYAYYYKEWAITDRNTLAGIVRAHVTAKENDMRLIIGCRLEITDGPPLLAYPKSRAGYANLCQLLTKGNLRAEKGACILYKQDVYDHAAQLTFIAVSPEIIPAGFSDNLKEYRSVFGRDLYIALTNYYRGDDIKRFAELSDIARVCAIKTVATNDVHYHHPSRRELQDIVTCIREKCSITQAGYRLFANAERHLKSVDEMARLFEAYPDAFRRTGEIADVCRFSLDELRYEYPDEIVTPGRSAQEELVALTWEGAAMRYPSGIPPKVSDVLKHELSFIEKLSYAPYFLTVYDAVRFAKSKEILCQGRGSAANSAVCYCLGITAVDPTKIDLLFERFVSDARNEPPDIDVDFEHERREEVMQYIYQKYGRDRAGIVATVNQYRQKGAIRDVGKAMGLSVDTINQLSKSAWRFTEWFESDNIAQQAQHAQDPHLAKTLALAAQLMGFPRHLSQHVGGFVITKHKLSDLCPIMNGAMAERTHIEWNKDDIDALGFMKVDCLSLGMLTCLKKTFNLLRNNYGHDFDIATIPQEDPATYDMICKADTIGVFQIESRAQMTMLPRLRPRTFYDLVIEVAIVRPGPIQGDMVHPYLRRRQKLEEVNYPSPELQQILEKTLGVPLFQEQAMKIAIVAAKFTPADADRLRRSMATFKAVGTINHFQEKLVGGMVANGYPADFAERVFKQLEGFGSYGFPESHAASFAQLVYVSAWLKCHYPDAFACGLLNSLPMGFYEPAQIIIDAQNHGVTVMPVDINYSTWDHQLEEKSGKHHALRLGFRLIKGFAKQDAENIVSARADGYRDAFSLKHRAGLTRGSLELLAQADGFGSLGLSRREAFWAVTALAEQDAALLAGTPAETIAEPAVSLPRMTDGEQVIHDYAATSLSLKNHPVRLLRDRLRGIKAVRASDLSLLPAGKLVKVAGLVLVRQRPGEGNVVFITLEDETGVSNMVVFKNVFEKFRKEILSARFLIAEGVLEKEGEVIHVVAKKFQSANGWLSTLARPDDFPLLSFAKDVKDVIPEARNFK